LALPQSERKPISVLFVAHSGRISGGANRSLLSLMEKLTANDAVKASVLIPQENSPLEEACRALGAQVYTAKYRTCCVIFRREAKDALRLGKLLAEPAMQRALAARLDRVLPRDIDLIYTNDRMTAVGAFLAARRGVPHVWHVRAFAKENKTSYPPRWMALMARYSSRIVVISSALEREFMRRSPAGKVCLVHNGIEPGPRRPREAHGGFNLLLCGRIVPSKGQDDAAAALALLKERGIDAQLYFAGELPSYEDQAYIDRLRDQIRRDGLEDRVHFLGEVSDMPALRARMDAELVCAWCEAFGRVTVEAMAAGLPVVGTDAGGTKDVLLPGETGLLYPPRDVRALADALAFLHDNRAEAARMGENGPARAAVFSMDNTAKRVNEVIAGALNDAQA